MYSKGEKGLQRRSTKKQSWWSCWKNTESIFAISVHKVFPTWRSPTYSNSPHFQPKSISWNVINISLPVQWQNCTSVHYNGRLRSYASYLNRYQSSRRDQENTDHAELFGHDDMESIPLRGARQKLEKCMPKLRKKMAVKQYHAVAHLHFKD